MSNIFTRGRFFLLINFLLVLPSLNAESSDLTLLGFDRSPSILSIADHEIHGLVTDSTGSPLPGVAVYVKEDKSIGTTTDLNGNYILTVPDNATIVFSMIGFDQQEIPVKGKTVINIKLLPSTSTLGETVIIGFGKQKKEDVIGSVTTVNPDDLRVPSSNLTTSLAGRVAGMIAFQRTGEPGRDNANFFIRGVSTFGTGKVDPLILIDGMELGTTALARLRPDDIASFSVLKDATATAVYGSRAANGVILIKTKEGREGKLNVSLRAEGSISMPTTDVEFADPVTYMRLYNEALKARDPFANKRYFNQQIDGTIEGKYPLLFPSVDWKDLLFKDYTFNHRYNLDVRGGGKVAQYYVAGSYSQDNGLLEVPKINNFNSNINLKSYTLRANVNINLTRSTELIVRLNGNFDDYNGPLHSGAYVYDQVVHASPVDFVPYYPIDSAHSFVKHIMFGGLAEHPFINPYAEMVRGYKDYTRSLMLAQLEINQDFSFLTKGLSFHAMMNTNRVSRFQLTRSYNPFYYDFDFVNYKTGEYSIANFNEKKATEYLGFSAGDEGRQQTSTFYLQSSLHYNRSFGKHDLSGMLVYIMQSKLNATPTSLQLSLPHRNLGVSGRATYAYDHRYYFEFNFGYNGSERFDARHRFGFFPSVGFAYNISNEEFWKPLKSTINSLKFRATYGIVGNDQIGEPDDRFFYLSEVDMTSSSRKSTFGLKINHSLDGIDVRRYANPFITWEIAHKANLGVDMTLFNDLEIKADFYKQTRTNILMSRKSIPSSMGLTASVQANVGEATGHGVDLSLNYNHAMPHRMWLQVYGNFTYARNVYKVYEEPDYEDAWWKSRIGYPLSQRWGYIAERLFIDNKDVANSPPQDFGSENVAGDIKYKDVNNDGRITSLDEVPIGYPRTPEIITGFGISFGWRNLDISAFFQGSAYSSFWINPGDVQPFVDGKQILKAFAEDHYDLENRNIYALWPRLSTTSHENNIKTSTWWMYNGRFLRIKQVELGYSLPFRLLDDLHLSKCRFYINGSNLLTFTQFKLWDVEMGGDGLGYPIQRVFNMGIKVTF